MPVETRISASFGNLVRLFMGEDTYGQGTIKTGISQAYLLAMGRGKVPTRAIVEKFSDGYKLADSNRTRILVAAGYEQPPPLEAIDAGLARLRQAGEITDIGKQQIEDFIKEHIQRSKPEAKEEGETEE